MQSYPKVKTVDAAWLGNIPEQWECKKVRSLFTYRNEKVSDKEFEPLSVSKMGVVPQLETAVKSDAGDKRKLVRAGDFVINSRSDRRGSCGVSDLDGSVTLISIVLEPHSCWSRKFVHYLLRSQPFSEEFFRNGRGIVDDLWTTRYSEMKNILLPVPPRSEQDQIVRFLDWQVSKIDKLIEGKKREIELLKELKKKNLNHAITNGLKPNVEQKKADVVWLSYIPKHWSVVRGKSILVKMERPVGSADEVVTVFRDGQVCRRSKRREEGFTFSILEIGYQGIEKGDLAVHGMDGFAGAIGISEDKGKCSPVVNVLTMRDKDTVDVRYVCFFLRMLAFNNTFIALSTGIRERSCDLRWKKIATLDFLLPPIGEQIEIANYIEKSNKKFDAQIKNWEHEIELLVEIKTRIISDVVTGTVDVRNIVIKE